MSTEEKWNSTRTLTITESHLIFPMIWEGDLNIHSNVEVMQDSNFQHVILHGDTSLALAISLIEKGLGKSITYHSISSRYQSYVCLHDEVYTIFQINDDMLTFSLINQKETVIVHGQLTGIEGCI